MLQYTDLLEEATPLSGQMSLLELEKHYGVHRVDDRFNDRILDWVNSNRRSAVTQFLKDADVILLSKLTFWATQVRKTNDYTVPVGSPEMFEEDLRKPVTVWRGGGGVFNPALPQSQSWVSCTASLQRAHTFAKFEATKAIQAWRLPVRLTRWWLAEITIPLDNILLYVPYGQDNEVIVRKKDMAGAKVIETGGMTSEELRNAFLANKLSVLTKQREEELDVEFKALRRH